MLLNEQHTVAELLVDAIAQKYTINGEMFSAEYLYKLTRKHFRDEDACLFHKGILNCDIVKEHLIAGMCLLVPYPFQKKNNEIIHKKKFKYYLKFEFDKCVGDING